MKAQIPWLRVGIEGLVIVGSILLAFGIDAWWDGVQEREEELSILVELESEFEANRAALVQTAEMYRITRGAMEALVTAFVSATEIPSPYLDTLFAAAVVPPHWEAASGALATALNSGRITLIRNGQLRNGLVGWDGITSDLRNDEDLRSEFVVRVLRPALAEFGIGGEPSTGFGTADFVAALRSRVVQAYLRNQIANISHILDHYADVEKEIDKLLVELSGELASR